jgi:superfamily II DNA or RNA helicase
MEWLSCDPHRALASCAIVQMPCGAGKTPWFLKTIAELGRCALVILPSKALVEQGITAARQFLPGLKTGYLYDGRKRIARTDIVFASIQTLARHVATNEPYLSELWAQTGTVCVDEGHHVVARTFWEVMSHCPALFRIVVTATPRRKDGLFAHLQWIAGPVIFASRRVLTDAVYVLAVNYTCTAEPDRHYDVPEKRPRYGRAALAPPRHAESGENIDKLFMEDRLCRDVDRDAIISALVCRLIAEQGRNVLIVTPRSEHVQAMACRLRADLEGIASAKRAPIAVPIPIKCPVVLQSFTRRVVSVPSVQHASSVEESDTAGAAIATRTVREGKYKRRRKQDDSSAATYSSRDDALAAYQQAVEQWEDTAQRFEDVVCEVPLVGTVVEGMEEHVRLLHYHSAACIATDRMMNEGVSHPPWDTLLLLTCSPEVEQVVGRILRTCPGKKVALVVDVYSRGPGQFLKGMFMARCTKYYGPSSFTVQHVDVGEAADVTASRLSLGRFNRIAR